MPSSYVVTGVIFVASLNWFSFPANHVSAVVPLMTENVWA